MRKGVSYQALKEECLAANLLIPEHRLAVFTFGNASALASDRGVFAIKPSGVPYSELKVEDMVVVDLEGHVVEGEKRPSSDTLTHAVLYRRFPEIGGIAHTHSTYATAWAQAITPIPVYGTTHADHLAASVPCTAIMQDQMIGGNYEEETGNQIARTLQGLSPVETEMVLVACHGPFTWGCDAAKAVYNSVVLEELAKMAMLTRMINPETPELKPSLLEKHYQRKHGESAYYGQ